MKTIWLSLALLYSGMLYAQSLKPTELTFATFNVSMEAENYVPRGTKDISEQILINELASGKNAQIHNIAKIIQSVRPDILLLNEFDYVKDPESGVLQFVRAYLRDSIDGHKGIDYPYYFFSTVNTGQPSPFDLDNNGKMEQWVQTPGDLACIQANTE